MIKILLT